MVDLDQKKKKIFQTAYSKIHGYTSRLENLGGWSLRLDFQLCLVSKIIGNGLQK